MRHAGDWRAAAVNGALLGLLCYGVYDSTNIALLNGWTLRISLLDVTWGAVATAVAAAVAFKAR